MLPAETASSSATILGLETAKFSSHSQYSQLCAWDQGGIEPRRSAQIPAEWDTLSFSVLDNRRLVILNHSPNHRDKSLLEVDLDDFFEGNLSPISSIPLLSRPTCARFHEGELYIAAYGMTEAEPAGIYVFKKSSGDKNWTRTRALVGPDFEGPIQFAFYKDWIVVANHLGKGVSFFDKHQNGVVRSILTIGDSLEDSCRFPLGVACHGDMLWITENVHGLINQYRLSVDTDPRPTLRAQKLSSKKCQPLPWSIAVTDERIWTTHVAPQSTSPGLCASGPMTDLQIVTVL